MHRLVQRTCQSTFVRVVNGCNVVTKVMVSLDSHMDVSVVFKGFAFYRDVGLYEAGVEHLLGGDRLRM